MIHSIREVYPEASNWVFYSSTVTGDFIIRIMEIWTQDGAHFIEAVILDRFGNHKMETKRLIDFA